MLPRLAALLETIGSGAVSNQVADGTLAEVIIVIGARPNDNHPVAATFMKNAAVNGSKLIVIEPYSSEMYLHAHAFLQLHPGTDVLLLNGMMYTIINEGLHDQSFIDAHTNGLPRSGKRCRRTARKKWRRSAVSLQGPSGR